MIQEIGWASTSYPVLNHIIGASEITLILLFKEREKKIGMALSWAIPHKG